MNVSYTVVGLMRDATNGNVTVTLAEIGGPSQVTVVLPAASPAIAALTIGRQINAVFTAV